MNVLYQMYALESQNEKLALQTIKLNCADFVYQATINHCNTMLTIDCFYNVICFESKINLNVDAEFSCNHQNFFIKMPWNLLMKHDKYLHSMHFTNNPLHSFKKFNESQTYETLCGLPKLNKFRCTKYMKIKDGCYDFEFETRNKKFLKKLDY